MSEGHYQAQLAFKRFASRVGAHPACAHSLFATMETSCRRGKINARQIDIFTQTMMARIFRTMPNIAALVETALLTGNQELLHTAMQNLNEEMGQLKTHQQLAEEAFNALRHAFDLPPLTLKQAYQHVPLPDSYAHEKIWLSGYHDFPAIASWLQERASGGINKEQQGMMADMFALFEACRARIGNASFKSHVLPYFAAHNKVSDNQGSYIIEFDSHAVEFQHGARAERDAFAEYAGLSCDQRDVAEKEAMAFLDAQDRLFSSLEEELYARATAVRVSGFSQGLTA